MKEIKNQKDHAQQIWPVNDSGKLTEVLAGDDKKSGLQCRRLDTFDLNRPPKQKKMKNGWMPERRTASVSSAGGLLKSTFITYQAIKVAANGEMVVIVTAEDEAEDYLAKFYSAIKTEESPHFGRDISDIASRILVVDVSGSGAKLYESSERRDKRSPWVDQMIAEVLTHENKVGFVAFETASRLCHGEDNTDFAAAIAVTDHVAMALDCPCVLTHHTGKGQARGKVVDQYSSRGGSSMGDNTRSALVFTKVDKEYKGIRQPIASEEELRSGEIIEIAHVRSSFGPLIPPYYILPVEGAGPAPALKVLESVKRGGNDERQLRKEQLADREALLDDLLIDHIEGRDSHRPLWAGFFYNDKDAREAYLNGASRDAVTKALARLVEADKLILKDAGKGKSKTYHLPGAHDAPKINSSNTDTEEADY